MKNKIHIILFTLCIFCANAKEKTFDGEYSSAYAKGDGFIKLKTDKNGSFLFVNQIGLQNDSIFGEYRYDGKTFYLVPCRIKNNQIEFEYVSDSCRGIHFVVYDKVKNIQLGKQEIFVYKNGVPIGNVYGNDLCYSNFDSAQVRYAGYKNYTFSPQKRNGVIVKIYLVSERYNIAREAIAIKTRRNKIVKFQSLVEEPVEFIDVKLPRILKFNNDNIYKYIDYAATEYRNIKKEPLNYFRMYHDERNDRFAIYCCDKIDPILVSPCRDFSPFPDTFYKHEYMFFYGDYVILTDESMRPFIEEAGEVSSVSVQTGMEHSVLVYITTNGEIKHVTDIDNFIVR